jgi:hypothetical protein
MARQEDQELKCTVAKRAGWKVSEEYGKDGMPYSLGGPKDVFSLWKSVLPCFVSISEVYSNFTCGTLKGVPLAGLVGGQ